MPLPIRNATREKKLDYFINSNGCHICTSHKCDNHGYPVITIDGKQDKIYRHIVRYEILDSTPIPKGLVIRHTCDNIKCINKHHLLIGEHKDNVADRVLRGRGATGESNGRSKLKEYQVLKIFNNTTLTNQELGRRYNIDRSCIRRIRNGSIWKKITGQV